MDQERWAKLDELLDAALERPPSARGRFIAGACAGDEKLRSELERLVELAEREDDGLAGNGALTGTLGEEVARALSYGDGAHEIQPGDRLGAYRLRKLLGKGGMGRVYVAEDTKLGRHVALKVLPPEMASPERRKRFEREAQAVASLNHPNIVHLYSVEEDQGVVFITMELVRGATLGEHITEGGLPLQKIFEIATQLADALACAHEHGIIHRDLKPTNVMLGEDGRVKILDFGLAKRFGDAKGGVFLARTLSATEEGHVIGTVSHMSPEQAEGKPLDPRTDIFSLGVILYEMSTGRLPFRGDTPTATLSSILKDAPPPVTELNPRLPRELARIVKRCLAKNPDRRYQTARDVRNDLEELEYELGSRKLFRSALTPSRRLGLGISAAVVTVAVAVGTLLMLRDGVENAGIDLLSGSFTQLTTEPGPELFPSLSPDGRFLVYASRAAGNWDIYLRRAGGRRSINLTEDSPADDTQPAISRDGEYIAFRSSRADGGLFVMGATGESVRRMTSFGWNPAWSPDGKTLVFATEGISRTPVDRPTTSALWTVDVGSGALEILTEGDAVQPSWSPGGHRIAYWGLVEGGGQRDIFTIPASGGSPVPVTQDAALDWNPVWSPDGRYLYFSSDRSGTMNLWRVPLDERTGEVRGAPEAVRAPATFATHASFSADGRRMVYASTLLSATLESVPFDLVSGTTEAWTRPEGKIRSVSAPRVSPDGEWIVYSRVGLQEDIVLVRADGSDERLLTDDPYRDRHPRWSPDGEHIAFYSNRGGTYEIWSVNRDGSGLRQLTDMPEHPTRYPVWSPDGTRLLFSSPSLTGILFDPEAPWDQQKPEPLPPYPSESEQFVPFDWSPDGRWIAAYLQSAAGVRAGIAVYSLETGRYEKLTDFGLVPTWLPDSRRIVFQGLAAETPATLDGELNYELFMVDRESREVQKVLAVPGASTEGPELAPGGHSLFFVLTSVEADIWMLDAGDAS